MVSAKDFLVTSAYDGDSHRLPKMKNGEYDRDVISKATESDIQKLDLALKYLQHNSAVTELLQKAVNNGVIIVMVKNGNNSYESNLPNNPDGAIYWNPNVGFNIFDDKMKFLGKMSSANTLLHEMVHAIDPNLAKSKNEIQEYLKTFSVFDTKFPYKNNAEYEAVTKANELVSNFHGEPTRADYITEPKEILVSNPIESLVNRYDSKGRFIGKTVKTYDDVTETIKTVHIDYLHRDKSGLPLKTETITDIDGKPIKKDPEKHTFDYQNLDWNSLSGSDLYRAVLSADSNQLDLMGKSLVQSEEGQRIFQLGENLLTEYKHQQELERQQEFERSSHVMVMRR